MWNHVASKWAGRLRDFGPNAFGTGRTGALCRAMIVSILFGAAGCTKVGPDFEPLSAPKSEQWIDEKDGRVKTDQGDYTTWWRVFNDPILNRLIDTAYRQNLDLLTENEGRNLRPGMAGRATILGSRHPIGWNLFHKPWYALVRMLNG